MKKKRIMVVEDEGITAMSIQSSLKKLGYDVTSLVFTGEEAVKKAEEEHPDLVLMDIVLDGRMDGIEAALQIHASCHIPVVYITAHSDEKMLRRIKESEPFGYIVKPFDDHELRMVVEIALYKNGMDRKLRESESELKKHRERLSRLVAERTADLSSAIELLKEEINERRRAEAETIRAGHLAALGELAAGVAHEINNPINGIINYAQLLVNKNKEGSTDQDIAMRIMKEGDRISDIVANLLSFARDSREKKHPVRIDTVISDALALIETQLGNDGIKLRVDLSLHMPEIMAQPQQIGQVILNIVSNARYALNEKYPGAHDDKVLEIHTDITGESNHSYAEITFYDKGCGIAAENMDKIMNPFFSTKPARSGTGLGLSISHGIISDHGGKLLIDSIDREFTKVIIKLPCRQVQASDVPAEQAR